MDSRSWMNRASLFSSSSHSQRYQSRSDLYLGGRGGYEDHEGGEDDLKSEFICPFCLEDFDIVGLCCHIDKEHPVEAKNGVCPVCTERVGSDIVSHITTRHASFSKVQRRRKLRKSGYTSAYLALKKELREANLKYLLGGSSSFTSSTNLDSDPLLSSFIFNSPSAKEPANKSSTPVSKGNSDTKVESIRRDIREAPCSGKDHEKAKKREFVRGLLLSAMLGDEY